VLNDASFDYMRTRALTAMLIASLSAQPESVFADQATWSAQLDRLGFTKLTTTPDPVQIATGQFVRAHGTGSMPNGWCTYWTPSPHRATQQKLKAGSDLLC
jgi:hypothetical protein